MTRLAESVGNLLAGQRSAWATERAELHHQLFTARCALARMTLIAEHTQAECAGLRDQLLTAQAEALRLQPTWSAA